MQTLCLTGRPVLTSDSVSHKEASTVIFRSVGTCPSVPHSTLRSVFRDPYCTYDFTVRIAEHRTRRGARNGRTCSNGTGHVPTERKITVLTSDSVSHREASWM